MPQLPDAGSGADVDVDDSHKYIGELVGIDEQPSTSQYKKSPNEMTVVHKFNLWDLEDGVAVIDNNTGEMYELWWFRRDTTFHNKTTGQIGEAREVANALLNKELTDDEVREMIREGWESNLIGKKVLLDLEWTTTLKGYPRLKVIRIKPYVPKRREPVQAASRRGRALEEDEGTDQ